MVKFIFGVLFGRILLPALSILIEMFEVYAEKVKARMSEDIAISNKKVTEYTEGNTQQPTRILGFSIDEQQEENEDVEL